MTPILKEIAEDIMKMLTTNPEVYLKVMAGSVATRMVLIDIYLQLIKDGKLLRVQELDHEHKLRLWEYVKEFYPDSVERQVGIEISKCVYTIEYILNNNL
jgi:hypothetical protein